MHFTTQCSLRLHQPFEVSPVPDKIKQPVAAILFGAATETPLSRMNSSLVHGVLDVHDGCEILTSKLCVERTIPNVYRAVCRMLKREAGKAGTQNLTVDGWQSSDNSLDLGLK